MNYWRLNLLFILCVAPVLATADAAVDSEIDYLLATVAESGCVFIRNGKEYSGDDARDHLALKRRRGKQYYDSADEFIERIASSSSWSGKPYQIRCSDEPQQPAGDWFKKVLVEYRMIATHE